MIPDAHFSDIGGGQGLLLLESYGRFVPTTLRQGWISLSSAQALDRACDRCQGRQKVKGPAQTAVDMPCPNCFDGRYTFPLEVEVECSHAVTSVSGGNYTAMEKCLMCRASRDGYGYTPWSDVHRSYRANIIKILPVYEECPGYKPANHICRIVRGEPVVLHLDDDADVTESPIVPPDSTQVGDHVALLKIREVPS